MKTTLCKNILIILSLTNAILYSQTPSLITKHPILVKPCIYQLTPSSPFNYEAKMMFVGEINPNGAACSVFFEYGPTTGYGSTIAASPALVEGTDVVIVRVTADIYNCEADYHCRIKAVDANGTTYYGADITFAPVKDPTSKLEILANRSADPITTSFTLINRNHFPVSVTCTDGTNSATLNLNSSESRDFTCSKNSMVSFYYNYTNLDGSTVYPYLFRKMRTIDDPVDALPPPIELITVESFGYFGNKDSVSHRITNANDIDVELVAICGAHQFTFIILRNSNKIYDWPYGAYDLYYNNILFISLYPQLVKTTYKWSQSASGSSWAYIDQTPIVNYAFPKKHYLDGADSTITLSTVTTSTNAAREVMGLQPWLNNGSITQSWTNDIPLNIPIQKNLTGQTRTGDIKVESNGGPYLVTVVQSGLTVPKQHLKMRLRADRGVVTSGSSVSEWNDMSGNNNNAMQSSSANQPTFISGAINNMHALRFSGSQFFSLPTAEALGIQNNAYELFIVARTNATQLVYLFSGATASQYEYHLCTSAPAARFIPNPSIYLDETPTGGTYMDGKAHVFSARASSTGGAVRVDGIDGAISSADITSSGSGNLVLGRRGADGTFYFEGDIAEVLIYDEILTAAQRDSVELYLTNRYGLTSGALPVELTSFSAEYRAKNVELKWQTATEVNNYGFEIERKSFDAEASSLGHSSSEGWRRIGFVQGFGNSNSPKNYLFTDSNLPNGKVQYRLKQIDFDGQFEYSDIVEAILEAPLQFSLEQNYPNPFNPVTTIKYSIPNVGTGFFLSVLKVYDILGSEVATLVNEPKSAGNYEVKFDASHLASGIYFYRLKSGSFVQTKKFVLMK